MISDERVLIKYKASFLQNGDVIVADTAEDSTVGKCSEIAGLNNEIVLSGLHTIPYRPKEKFASGYLGYYLNSDSYHNQLIPLMQGIKVTSISKSALRNTDIIYPESKEEQAKIGNYFQSLENRESLIQYNLIHIYVPIHFRYSVHKPPTLWLVSILPSDKIHDHNHVYHFHHQRLASLFYFVFHDIK